MVDEHMKTSFRAAFESYYPAGRAEGMSFTDMRKIIPDAGFDPSSHAVISWSTSVDLQVFFKALSGIDQPFVAPTVKENFQLRNDLNYFTGLQSINIFHLAKNMMRAKPKQGFALTEVYRALFGIEDVEAHLAPCDTIMELDTLRIFASSTT